MCEGGAGLLATGIINTSLVGGGRWGVILAATAERATA